jgi:hypothetical protein
MKFMDISHEAHDKLLDEISEIPDLASGGSNELVPFPNER